jgi:hypothetical protein
MGQQWDVTSNEYFENFCAFRTQAILAGKKITIELKTTTPGNRTPTQNRCLHEYCRNVAVALNEAGYNRVISSPVLSKDIELEWDMQSVKDLIWRHVQIAQTGGKESSTSLTTIECSAIYEIISRYLASQFGLQVLWPTRFEG